MSLAFVMNPAFTTTLRFSLLDLWRSRWLALVVALVAVALGAGGFAGQLGLTEQHRIAVAFAAPLVRLMAVLVVIVLVHAAISREAGERSHQLALAAALSRTGWVVAKWASFMVMAALTAFACGASITWLVVDAERLAAALAWTVSLALELCIVASIALTIALALSHLGAAILASLAVYCAARLFGVILLLGTRADTGALGQIVDSPLQLLGRLLPRLDLFARTDWLVHSGVVQQNFQASLGAQIGQTMLYCALMLAVAAVDFRRRELS